MARQPKRLSTLATLTIMISGIVALYLYDKYIDSTKICDNPSVMQATDIWQTGDGEEKILWQKEIIVASQEQEVLNFAAISDQILAMSIPGHGKQNCYEQVVVVGIDTDSGDELWHSEDIHSVKIFAAKNGFVLKRLDTMEYILLDNTMIWEQNSRLINNNLSVRWIDRFISVENTKWIFLQTNWFKNIVYDTQTQEHDIYDTGLPILAQYGDTQVKMARPMELFIVRESETIPIEPIVAREYQGVPDVYMSGNVAVVVGFEDSRRIFIKAYDLTSGLPVWSNDYVEGRLGAYSVTNDYVTFISGNQIKVHDFQTGRVLYSIPLESPSNPMTLSNRVTWLGMSGKTLIVRLLFPRSIVAISLED